MRATYRLQLGPDLGFDAARALVPYLRELGVSHLYLSPSLQARSGSTHGYDVTDPRRISEDLGGEAAFRALASAGLPVLLDVVPNHMAACDENPFWADPFERHRFFDLDPATGRHRRFFSIDELAGVRVEEPEVFEATHGLVLRLVAEGVVWGLRVDHPDGLADPAGYLERLAARGVERIWVEKILEPGEELPGWPVEGTTGYEFMADATALFIDPAGEAPLTALYAELTGERRTFAQIADEAKHAQAQTTFAPEVERLARLAPEGVGEQEIAEAVASLPVYRTYHEPEPDAPHEELVTRFQQTTGAVMAKGVEDTAHYRYHRLVALNEVGSDPDRFSLAPEDMHAANAARLARFPRGLLATQTHDTKRSGDVRARIGALAGIAGEWRERVLGWRARNAHLRRDERGAPDPNEEYLVYQTLVGAWPISPERLRAYMEKAVREAKVNTSWVAPDAEHERAVAGFCEGLLADAGFVAELEELVGRVAPAGQRAALGQTLLALTAPGVPDIYQGDELWCRSLVDPDNRRPVDWGRRRAALAGLPGLPERGAEADPESLKLLVIHRALGLRARHPEAFGPEGAYQPLPAGAAALAYARGGVALVAMPLYAAGEDATVRVPAELRGAWRQVVTGGHVEVGAEASLAALRDGFAVALLERL